MEAQIPEQAIYTRLRTDLVAGLDRLAEVWSQERGGARVSRADLIRQAVAAFLSRHPEHGTGQM